MGLRLGHLVEPLFVGREAEIEELEAYLKSAIQEKGKTVFIEGEAGTGKTRLLNEFLKNVDEQNVTLLSGQCLSNISIPYFPFMEAFNTYAANNNDKKTTEFFQKLAIPRRISGLPEEKGEVESLTPQNWKDQMFAVVTNELLQMSKNKPIIFTIEDIHWADSASILLMYYISRAIRSARVLLLATFRSEELNVDSAGHPHPLTEVHRFMKRDNLLEEIILSNLSQPNIEEIAESMLGGQIHDELLEKLAQESQGNPLFIVESIRMLHEQKHIVKEKNRWQLSVDSIGIPPKVKDLILRRIGNLNQGDRKILNLASVIGDKFNPKLLGTLLSQDSLNILETLNTVMQTTSLVRVEGESYRFDHSKSREVLYEQIPLPLKIGYHEKIADIIENTSQTGNAPISDLAYHYTQAGNKSKSIKYALAAGQDALAKFANNEAAKHFNYVLETLPGEPEFANERAQALEGLGDAYFARSLFEDATKVFEQVRKNTESGNTKLRTLRKAMASSRWRGDLTHSLELANKAQEYSSFNRLEYARIRALRGTITGLRGNMLEGLIDLESALRIFEEEYSLPDLRDALYEVANFYASEGQIEKTLRAVTRSIALAEDLQDLRARMETHFSAGNILFNCRLYKEAQDKYEKAIKEGEIVGDYNTVAWAYVYTGVMLESIGDFTTAISKTSKGKELAEKTDASYIQSMAHTNLTIQYSRQGDLEHAKEHYQQLQKYFPEISAIGSKVAKAAVLRAKAVYLAAIKQYTEAHQLFEESLALHTGTFYSKLYETITRTEYAWALEKENKTQEAQIQTRKVEEIYKDLDQQTAKCTVEADLLATKKVKANEKFTARLDIINLSKNPVTLLRVDGIVPSEIKINTIPPDTQLKDLSIEMNQAKLDPYRVKPIAITLEATRPGTFNLNPKIVYTEQTGKTVTTTPNPIRITVTPTHIQKEAPQIEQPSAEFEFKTNAAKDTFKFLVAAFIEDYMRRRLPTELSGWRTLMDIIKHTKIPKRMLYGNGAYRGRAINELERRGLVEIRVFPKERGRGGRILKTRIFYEKETIKRQIDDKIMTTGKNK
jgi:tetratricopeptide (TPR) repeat protein